MKFGYVMKGGQPIHVLHGSTVVIYDPLVGRREIPVNFVEAATWLEAVRKIGMGDSRDTIDDIVAEMRAPHEEICEKCHEEPNESCPYCGDPDGCNSPDYGRWPGIMEQLADRIEAAAKRERGAAWNEGYDHAKRDFRPIADELERLRNTPIGNAAKLREALRKIMGLFRDIDLTEDTPENEAYAIAASALAEPPRNCDRFETFGDALAAWREVSPAESGPFDDWLFDTAEKGASDEQK